MKVSSPGSAETRSKARRYLLALLLPVCAEAACVKPEKPDPPLNANSDKATFQRTHQQTQAYLQRANEHLRCLDEERGAAAQAGRDNPEQEKARMRDYNATVDDIRQVSANLQEQERKFKQAPTQ